MKALKETIFPLTARYYMKSLRVRNVSTVEELYSLTRSMLIILFLGHLSRMITFGIWFFLVRLDRVFDDPFKLVNQLITVVKIYSCL